VKILALLILPPTLIAAAATATLAHVDTLGQPDPSWQQPAAARDTRAGADGTAPQEDFFSSGGLSLLLLALGALLALDLATAPGSRSALATALPSAAPPDRPPEAGLRTVEVLPASVNRETRYVLRVAMAIVLAAILLGELHSSDSSDRAPDGKPPPRAGADRP